MQTDQYPALEINLAAVRQNTEAVAALLSARGITLTGVVKGFNALMPVVEAMAAGGCSHLASSRMDQLKRLREGGIALPLMLLRIPMLSEADAVTEIVDISLNSEWDTVEALNEAALAKGRRHGVILMQDLGDLREGFWDADELTALALHVERNLAGLELKGVGTNLGCYGAIRPTEENLGALVGTARRIEVQIGRRLEIVSGGATSSLPLLQSGSMPEGITNLRVGEGILNNRDLPDIWQVPMPGLTADTFTLEAQVVEVKLKPSHPVGEVFIDAFGNRPVYEDRGIRRRAILAVGRQDLCDPDKLIPLRPGVEIVGASSDHLIVDVHGDAPPRVGDVLKFSMYYGPMLFLSASSGVVKRYRNAD